MRTWATWRFEPLPEVAEGGPMSGSLLAYVALREAEPVGAAEVLRLFNAKAAPLGVSALRIGEDELPGTMMIDVAGQSFAVMMHMRPLPADTVVVALSMESRWVEAESDLADAIAYLVVSILDEPEDHASALSGAMFMTLLVGCMIELMPSIGVLWAAGQTLTPAEKFRELADAVVEQNLPFHAWMKVMVMRGENTPDGQETTSAATLGLEPFVGREINFVPTALPREAVADKTFSAAQYLLVNGPRFEEGSLYGTSPLERIRVGLLPFGTKPGVPVYQLKVEMVDLPRPAPALPLPGTYRKARSRPFGRRAI